MSTFLLQFEESLITWLANSATFQDLVGAANATEAREYIHNFRTADVTDIAQTAKALVGPASPVVMTRDARGTGIAGFTWKKTAAFLIMQDVSAFSEAAAEQFLQTVSDILVEITQQTDVIWTITEDDATLIDMRWRSEDRIGYQKRFILSSGEK